MITSYILEDYCSEEITSLLEENGYIGSTNTYLDKDGFRVKEITLQSAMKWLRDEHGLHCNIGYNNINWYWEIQVVHRPVIEKTENQMLPAIDVVRITYDSYEEACEEAIKYCLENLI